MSDWKPTSFIWATDVVEHVDEVQVDKNASFQTWEKRYRYTVTAAIALGRVDRPIVRVNAAWAYAPVGAAARDEGRFPPSSWGPIELDLSVLD